MCSLLMVSGVYCEIGGLSIYHKNASNKMHQHTYMLLCSTLTEEGSVCHSSIIYSYMLKHLNEYFFKIRNSD